MFDPEKKSSNYEEDELNNLILGRPNRNRVIQRDEIINLEITLQTTNSVEEFLKLI